jgi:hypothetical protein
MTFWEVVRENYCLGGGSAESPFGRWLGGITCREVIGKLLPGRWFGETTPRKIIQGNYPRGDGSAELPLGRWFGKLLPERWFGKTHS